VNFLSGSEHALLSDQMGLGKTVQTITAARVVHRSRPGSRSLIVAPASLLRNWEEELNRWGPEFVCRRLEGSKADRKALLNLPVAILLASFERVRTDIELVREAGEQEIVIVDEAQRIKNSSSAMAMACRAIPRRRSWALTGTPLENSSDDLVSVFGFVMPGLLSKGMSPGECHSLIRPYFLRRTKREVLPELPPIEVQDLPLELLPAQRRSYDAVWGGRHALSDGSQGNLLAAITRLKQLCNRDAATGESSKLSALSLILEEAKSDGSKTLVFSQYVETLEWLRAQIEGQPVFMYHGGQDDRGKQRALADFKTHDGCCVLLVSLKAGGVGLNVNEADTVVMFDRWWNPAVESQAIQRAHRFGRQTSLFVVRFLVRDTVEERINDILERKGLLFRNYIEDAPTAEVVPLEQNELRLILDLPSRHVADAKTEQAREA